MVTRIGWRPPRNAPAFLFNPRQLIPHSRSINQSPLASSLSRAIPMASCSRNQSAGFRATVRGPSAPHPNHNSSNQDLRRERREHSCLRIAVNVCCFARSQLITNALPDQRRSSCALYYVCLRFCLLRQCGVKVIRRKHNNRPHRHPLQPAALPVCSRILQEQ